jgi:uncharacterized protein
MMDKKVFGSTGIRADFFYKPSKEPQKAIIMLGGSEGGKSWSRINKPIELLLQRGYALLSLAYFKSEGLPDTLEEIPLEYFEKAFDWLSNQPGIIKDQYAILGGSKGAEAALLMGSRSPRVKAVIAFSPSSVIWQGIPANRFELSKDPKSSWSVKGVGLPFLPYSTSISKWDLRLLNLNKMHTSALQDAGMENKAFIKVEKIQGAVLLISGKHDRLWPAAEMSEQIMDRLKAHDFVYPYEHLVLGGGHNQIVINKNSWSKIFDFLSAHF